LAFWALAIGPVSVMLWVRRGAAAPRDTMTEANAPAPPHALPASPEAHQPRAA